MYNKTKGGVRLKRIGASVTTPIKELYCIVLRSYTILKLAKLDYAGKTMKVGGKEPFWPRWLATCP